MFQEKFCEECRQKHSCREVYRHLGKAKGPSVVIKVVVAFLVPLVVFITALAISEKILAGIINSKEVQTVLSLLLALAVTAVCILIIKVIGRRRMTDGVP